MIIHSILCLFFGVYFGESFKYVQQYPRYNNIIEPCPKLTEDCIRSYFRSHSRCIPVYGDVPNILYDMNKLEYPLPNANVSFKWEAPLKEKGLNDGKIVTFYVNRRTRKLVLEAEFRSITIYSQSSVKYYFRGREPVQKFGFFEATHNNVSLTAIIETDSNSGIKWEKKEVYSYFGDPVFPVVADPSLCGTEPEVQAACKVWKENMVLNAKESSLNNGPYFFHHFFEGRICKFTHWN